MSLQDHVTAITATAASVVGLDPLTMLTIVSTLLPLLAQCFSGTPQSAKQYLSEHYDETSATFDQSIIDQARPRARRAARIQGQRRLSRDQLDAITVASFNHAMSLDDSSLASAVVEAAQQLFGDSDNGDNS